MREYGWFYLGSLECLKAVRMDYIIESRLLGLGIEWKLIISVQYSILAFFCFLVQCLSVKQILKCGRLKLIEKPKSVRDWMKHLQAV
jgi:hypothetical protein